MQRAQAQELQLLLTRQAMASELHCVQGQLGQYHQQLEEGRAELSKSQELHAALKKELKVGSLEGFKLLNLFSTADTASSACICVC